jgi:hypothetical protein
MARIIEAVPDYSARARPLFASAEAHEKARVRFAQAVRPELEKARMARMKSEERARTHKLR